MTEPQRPVSEADVEAFARRCLKALSGLFEPHWLESLACGIEGTQLLRIWLPLDPVPKNSCPEFMAGSHRLGKRFVPRLFINHQNYTKVPHGHEHVPEIGAQG